MLIFVFLVILLKSCPRSDLSYKYLINVFVSKWIYYFNYVANYLKLYIGYFSNSRNA